MRKHPVRLENAGISPARYRELKDMCQQYPEYMAKIRRVRAGIVDKPRRKAGAWTQPDPTGNAAASIADEVAWMEARVKLIDMCARRAAPPAVARAIIKSATEGWSYDRLRQSKAYRPPCGFNQFYEAKLTFYIILDMEARS